MGEGCAWALRVNVCPTMNALNEGDKPISEGE